MVETQPLLLPQIDRAVSQKNIEWLLNALVGCDWRTAVELLDCVGLPATEDNRRMIRELAAASQGRVCGHQRGYKLNKEMTEGEYQHWRSEWLKSSDAIRARVVAADRHRYPRKPA